MDRLRIIDLVSTDEQQKFEPAGAIAAAIVDIICEQGGCLPQDLNQKGFAPDDVARYWPLAKTLADAELKAMKGSAAQPKFFWRKK